MKGTILDFLTLVAEQPELARRLAQLASEYDFEFTADELTDGELEAVSGGTLDAMAQMSQMDQLQLQDAMNKQAEALQTISSIMKSMHDTQNAIIQNMR